MNLADALQAGADAQQLATEGILHMLTYTSAAPTPNPQKKAQEAAQVPSLHTLSFACFCMEAKGSSAHQHLFLENTNLGSDVHLELSTCTAH